MILDIGAQSRPIPDSAIIARSQIFRFSPGGAVGARLLKLSNRFTAYSIYPIELKLGMKILDINLHNRYEQDF